MIARLQHSGLKFEILVDSQKALEFKKGANIAMDDILAYPAIYKDAKASEAVSAEDLQTAFGTKDVYAVADRILKKGEIQITTEQRKGMVEQKKMQVASIISRRGINPQTNAPHPQQRILSAMEKSSVSIDPFQDAELQVDKVVKAIKIQLPIRFQKVTLMIKVPASVAAKSYSVLKSSGTIINEKWLDDGGLQVDIEMLAGLQDELFTKLSGLTHGNYESKVIKREDLDGS